MAYSVDPDQMLRSAGLSVPIFMVIMVIVLICTKLYLVCLQLKCLGNAIHNEPDDR